MTWNNLRRAAVCTALLSLFSVSSFAVPLPGDEHWDPQFGCVGATDSINAMTVRGKTVFVGGLLLGAGNAKSKGVAAYDGTNWYALNNAVIDTASPIVFDVATDSQYAYYGGWFTNMDNVAGVKYLARWDGTNWSGLGSGVNSIVNGLKIVGSDLYVGGYFPSAGGLTVNGLARWNGTAWSAVGGGVNSGGYVSAIESGGANLYVAGSFNTVGGTTAANNIAAWDGNNWSALGSGITGTVRKMAWHNNQLYVGGSFTNVGGVLCTNLVIWNGSSWVAWGNANDVVRDVISDGVNVYVSGDFTNVSGVAASRIAKWNGVAWSALGEGVKGFGVSAAPSISRMAFGSDGRLYVAGNFNILGSAGASHVGAWDGTNWFGLGGKASKGMTHFLGSVQSLLAVGTNLYAGGVFTEAGDLVVNSIARWNGTNWSTLGSGLTGTFTTGVAPSGRGLLAAGNVLYVAGNFTNAGGVSAKGVAKWDGTNWSALGLGVDASSRGIAMIGQNLYVGGSFTNAGGVFSPRIAKWDGNAWSSIGGVSSAGTYSVNVLATNGTDLYVGGAFTSAGGVPASCIAKWDGATWSALGAGVNTNVSAMAFDTNGVLYVGGSFTFAGGSSIPRIAKWNGATWSGLGTGISGTTASASVSAITIRGTDVYVAGTFTNAGGILAVGLAKWNGSSWSALGSGLVGAPGTATGSALAYIGNDLFVGGNFIFAGEKPSMFLARWNDQLNFYPAPKPTLVNFLVKTNGQFQFRLNGTSGERYIIQGSTNFSNWTPLVTSTVPMFDFIDTNASGFKSRVYRVIPGP